MMLVQYRRFAGSLFVFFFAWSFGTNSVFNYLKNTCGVCSLFSDKLDEVISGHALSTMLVILECRILQTETNN